VDEAVNMLDPRQALEDLLKQTRAKPHAKSEAEPAAKPVIRYRADIAAKHAASAPAAGAANAGRVAAMATPRKNQWGDVEGLLAMLDGQSRRKGGTAGLVGLEGHWRTRPVGNAWHEVGGLAWICLLHESVG
jgi:hypothetical protein